MIVLPFNPVGWFETSSGTLLNVNQGGTSPLLSGTVVYTEVDADGRQYDA
jgi:hypothetical protein